MSASDAVILLVADGLVAAGRVLGGLRRRCAAEKHADAVNALNALEDSQDGLDPGQLARPSMGSLLDAYWAAKSPEVETQALDDLRKYYPERHWADDFWADDSASAAVSTPAADNTTDKPDALQEALRDADLTVTYRRWMSGDNTTDVDHLEAAWHYHRPQANYNGTLVWGCEGCNWHGSTIQAHSRHRFQVLADMKNATHRVQEQLGGAS